MKQNLLIVCLLWAAMVGGCASKPNYQISHSGQSPQVLNRHVTMKLNYLLYLPKDYGKEQKSWPLLVFLHGAGERGSDLNLIKRFGPPKLIEEGREFPFIIVSPQCQADKWWYMGEHIMALIDETVERYNVDENRIYLTGLSMGGFGTWFIAGMYPERFAAIAPICGGGCTDTAETLKNVPVWAFHGDQDTTVPLQMSQEMVDAVNRTGGHAKLTIYPGINHDSWTATYNNPELYEWLLSHSKKQD